MEKYESNEPKKDKVVIPRNSPELRIKLGGRVITLTWYNTLLQFYRSPYVFMSHIAIVNEDGVAESLLTNKYREKTQELMTKRFPIRFDSEPADYILEAYAAGQDAKLNSDLNLLNDIGADAIDYFPYIDDDYPWDDS